MQPVEHIEQAGSFCHEWIGPKKIVLIQHQKISSYILLSGGVDDLVETRPETGSMHIGHG